MEIVLLEDVKALGKKGQVVKVMMVTHATLSFQRS